VLVITAKHALSFKGEVWAPESEVVAGVEFFRPYADSGVIRKYPLQQWDAIAAKVSGFGPDVVIGFGEFNFRLPSSISKRFGIPLFLYMEYLRPGKIAYPIRGKRLLRKYAPSLDRLASKMFLRYLSRRVHGIMYAYAGDQSYARRLEQNGTPVFYVPWCTEVREDGETIERNRRIGIYIGSLETFKNAEELVKAVPLILDKTLTERFIVVGPGPYATHIQRLAENYEGRLTYIPSVPRAEAMRLLRSAGYGYTPVKDCGLGFIGDCWATGTPLVTTHLLDGFLNPGRDTLVANGWEDLPRVIEELLRSEKLFSRCEQEGRARYKENFTGKAVGEKYLEVIDKCLRGGFVVTGVNASGSRTTRVGACDKT
jgi:glycosyltransferase involved in cell wall biosynthesis